MTKQAIVRIEVDKDSLALIDRFRDVNLRALGKPKTRTAAVREMVSLYATGQVKAAMPTVEQYAMMLRLMYEQAKSLATQLLRQGLLDVAAEPVPVDCRIEPPIDNTNQGAARFIVEVGEVEILTLDIVESEYPFMVIALQRAFPNIETIDVDAVASSLDTTAQVKESA